MNTDPLMPDRYTGVWFTLDTNRINSRKNDSLMNQLESWQRDGVINLTISQPASDEVRKGGGPLRFAKVQQYVHSQTLASTSGELDDFNRIASVLLGRAPETENEKFDIAILFNVKKYGRPLITEDGDSRSQAVGILGKRNELMAIGISVFRTRDAVAFVKRRIHNRDKLATILSNKNGNPVPDWVGKD